MPDLNPLPQNLPDPSGRVPSFAEPKLPDLSPTRLRPPGGDPTTAIVPYRPPAPTSPVTRINPVPIIRRAAPRAAWRLAPRLARGALGPIGGLLLAADLLELLYPVLKDWMDKEAPGSISVPVGAPLYPGGQGVNVRYSLGATVTYRFCNSPSVVKTTSPNLGVTAAYGPLGGISIIDQCSSTTNPKIRIAGRDTVDGPYVWKTLASGERNCEIIGFNILIERLDGLPDTDGNRPGEPINYPVKQREPRYIPFPITIPVGGIPSHMTPPSQTGGTSPGIGESKDPKTPIIIIPGGNPYRPPINPDTGEEEDPGPIIKRPNTLPVPVPVPDYKFDDPYKPPPTKPSEDEECNNPCNKFTWDLLDFTIELILDLKKPKEECPELFKMVVPYVECEDGNAETKYGQIQYAFKTPPDLQQKLIDTAILANAGCSEDTCVSAVPEWWAVRPGADRPQLVFVYRVQGGRTYHEIAVPHPANTSKTDVPVIPTYQKGNWMARVRFSDNTNITVYGATANEASRVASALADLVSPAYQTNPRDITVFERRGTPVAEAMMKCVSIMYYPRGRKSSYPEWRSRVASPY